MTDQTIPADKVRELKTKYEYDTSGDPERLLDHLLHDLDDLLPTLPQPTTGLLGRWAKHPEHGDVVCIWDKPMEGRITVWYRNDNSPTGSLYGLVPLDSLTFPEQATKPEDVPAGEAWLVDVKDSKESHKSIVALKYTCDDWRTSDEVTVCNCWDDWEVTLISPLTPECPVSDLQAKSTERALDRVKAKYDELNAKYREAQERIKTLEQANAPRTVTTPEEYDALPEGSMVQISRGSSVMEKFEDGLWRSGSTGIGDTLHSSVTRIVLRYGWGDEQPEQPAWRIEHDWQNLKAGEYIIDKDGDTGVTEIKYLAGKFWYTDGSAVGRANYAPFIVFPNKDAATPEAIEEAKRARDKETGE